MHFKLWPEPSHPLFYGTSLSTLPYEICSETVIFGILKSNKGNLKHIFQVIWVSTRRRLSGSGTCLSHTNVCKVSWRVDSAAMAP